MPLRSLTARSPFAQFLLLGLRGVLREKSVLFWSFLFPVMVTAIFVQAFSPEGRPQPLLLGVARLPAESGPWLAELAKEDGVKIVDVEDEIAEAPGYAATLSLSAAPTPPHFLPAPLKKIFFGEQVDALLTDEGFFSIKSPQAAARDGDRLLAAKARARGEALAVRPVALKGAGFADWFAPGMIGLTILTGGLFGTSFRLSSDREKGLFRRFMLTPFRRSDYVLGFVAARGVFVVCQAALLLLLFRWFFGFEVQGSLVLFFVLAILGAASANLLGAAVAARVRRSEVAGGVANVFFFPMMFLSGVYFKTESLPPWLKSATDFLSLSALTSALRKVANEGAGVSAVGFETAVMGGWSLACLLIAVTFFDWGTED